MDESSKKQQKTAEGAELSDLPDQRLIQAKKAMRYLEEAGFRARLAGGCVRDRILGIKPKDFDIASDARPEDVSLLFKQKGLKVVPTGIDHGTMTIVIGGQGIEITTLRKDIATDGRRAVVSFGSSFEEDAERRDFTMNALYEDLQGQIYDYFEGRSDMQKRKLRFVGQAEERIREDYLRILRLFRFWARFGFRPDQSTLDAVKREVGGLSQISQERCTGEIFLLLAEEDIDEVLDAMKVSGVLDQTLDLKAETSIQALSAFKSIRKAERAVSRLAALLIPGRTPEELSEALARLRLSKTQILQILSLAQPPSLEEAHHADPARLMDILDHLEKIWGTNALIASALPSIELIHPDRARLCGQLRRVEEQSGPRRRSPLPLNGQDLMKSFGLESGPKLGALVQRLKEAFRRGEWNEPREGIKLAQRILQSSEQS